MNLAQDLPRPIELCDPVWITLPDGCRLATLEAYEGETRGFARSYDAAVPRTNF